jgi:hypothetical protein
LSSRMEIVPIGFAAMYSSAASTALRIVAPL